MHEVPDFIVLIVNLDGLKTHYNLKKKKTLWHCCLVYDSLLLDEVYWPGCLDMSGPVTQHGRLGGLIVFAYSFRNFSPSSVG